MVCPHCGADSPPLSGRCTACGKPVGTSAGAETPRPPLGSSTSGSKPHPDLAEPDAPTTLSANPVPFTGHLAAGQSFGPRYDIVRLVGVGGMGAVYHAWDRELAVAVALKVIRPEVLHDPTAADDIERRFKRELLLARQVTHKNVIRIHDLGELNGIKYITMPFVEGEDLSSILKREGKLPVARALALARQIVDGLSAAHEVGVVHRDLKPANIMVDSADHALIMDFGIARSVGGSAGLTMSRGVVGTLKYMAPEQASARPVDHRADIYAFGLILYDMVAGNQRVGESETVMTELMQRMQRAPPSVRSIDPTIPEAFAGLIDTCVQPKPAARFQQTADVAAALGRLDELGQGAREGTLASAGVTGWARDRLLRRPRAWQWAVGAGVVAAVAATIWLGPHVTDSLVSEPVPAVPAASTDRTRVAVLPFEVTGDAAALDHVATGIREALSAKLFHLNQINLTAGSAIDGASTLGSGSLERIGRELGASLIVTGTLDIVDGRLQVDVRLDDVSAGQRVLNRQYTGLPEDLLALEDRMYEELVAALDLTPTSDERARAITHPTENFEAYELYLKGRNAMRGVENPQNVETAIAFYEQALSEDAGFALAYAGIANGALQMYRFTRDSTWTARALSAAEQAGRLDDTLTEVHLALGNVYRSTGRAAEGIAELRRATQLAPNSDDAYRRLGRAYVESGRAEEGIAALQQAIAINPYFWINYNTLGAAFLQLGDYDQAIQANLKVLDLEPDNVNGYNDLGVAYLFTGQFEPAVEMLETAVSLLPTPDALTNLAISYYYMGRFNEAVPLFERAVELSPNDEQWVGNLADGYRLAGLTTQATATYDRAIDLALNQLQINTRDATVRGYLGLYYVKNGDVAQGLRFISAARAIDGANVELMYVQALANAVANRPSEALDALEAALAAGYSVAFAANEPDLQVLQSEPRFAELLKGYSFR